MRSIPWARWATCALAITVVSFPALADRTKSLSDCTSFHQTEKGEDVIELGIQNSCKVPVDCSIKWRVVCAPDAPKRKAVHAKSMTLKLVEGASSSTEASAAVCGDDAFTIDSIQWGCEPNKD